MFRHCVFILTIILGTVSCEINAIDQDLEETPLSVVSFKEMRVFSGDYSHFCGGSILNERWILTAGHCFSSYLHSNLHRLVVDVGSEYLSNGTRYKILNFHIHPNQSESIEIYRNDLALIQLQTAIDLGENARPVRLGAIKDQKEVAVVASGWGRVSQHGNLHQKLRHLHMKTLKYRICQKIHDKKHNIVDKEAHICASAGLGKSLCFGDSGGPLFDQRGYQVGVFSALEDCSGEFPVLFMRIESYLDWINDVTNLNLTLS